jgi:hypothetical protein
MLLTTAAQQRSYPLECSLTPPMPYETFTKPPHMHSLHVHGRQKYSLPAHAPGNLLSRLRAVLEAHSALPLPALHFTPCILPHTPLATTHRSRNATRRYCTHIQAHAAQALLHRLTRNSAPYRLPKNGKGNGNTWKVRGFTMVKGPSVITLSPSGACPGGCGAGGFTHAAPLNFPNFPK